MKKDERIFVTLTAEQEKFIKKMLGKVGLSKPEVIRYCVQRVIDSDVDKKRS